MTGYAIRHREINDYIQKLIWLVMSVDHYFYIVVSKRLGEPAIVVGQRDGLNFPADEALHESTLLLRCQFAQNPVAFARNLYRNLTRHLSRRSPRPRSLGKDVQISERQLRDEGSSLLELLVCFPRKA